MEPLHLPSDDAQQPEQPSQPDDLLHELAGLTGLFNPEQIWLKEERLDNLEEPPPHEEA